MQRAAWLVFLHLALGAVAFGVAAVGVYDLGVVPVPGEAHWPNAVAVLIATPTAVVNVVCALRFAQPPGTTG